MEKRFRRWIALLLSFALVWTGGIAEAAGFIAQREASLPRLVCTPNNAAYFTEQAIMARLVTPPHAKIQLGGLFRRMLKPTLAERAAVGAVSAGGLFALWSAFARLATMTINVTLTPVNAAYSTVQQISMKVLETKVIDANHRTLWSLFGKASEHIAQINNVNPRHLQLHQVIRTGRVIVESIQAPNIPQLSHPVVTMMAHPMLNQIYTTLDPFVGLFAAIVVMSGIVAVGLLVGYAISRIVMSRRRLTAGGTQAPSPFGPAPRSRVAIGFGLLMSFITPGFAQAPVSTPELFKDANQVTVHQQELQDQLKKSEKKVWPITSNVKVDAERGSFVTGGKLPITLRIPAVTYTRDKPGRPMRFDDARKATLKDARDAAKAAMDLAKQRQPIVDAFLDYADSHLLSTLIGEGGAMAQKVLDQAKLEQQKEHTSDWDSAAWENASLGIRETWDRDQSQANASAHRAWLDVIRLSGIPRGQTPQGLTDLPTDPVAQGGLVDFHALSDYLNPDHDAQPNVQAALFNLREAQYHSEMLVEGTCELGAGCKKC